MQRSSLNGGWKLLKRVTPFKKMPPEHLLPAVSISDHKGATRLNCFWWHSGASTWEPPLKCIEHETDQRDGWSSYSIVGVVVLLHRQLDALHADLQDAGGRRVVLHRHPSVGGNLGNRWERERDETTKVLLWAFCCCHYTVWTLGGNLRLCRVKPMRKCL